MIVTRSTDRMTTLKGLVTVTVEIRSIVSYWSLRELEFNDALSIAFGARINDQQHPTHRRTVTLSPRGEVSRQHIHFVSSFAIDGLVVFRLLETMQAVHCHRCVDASVACDSVLTKSLGVVIAWILIRKTPLHGCWLLCSARRESIRIIGGMKRTMIITYRLTPSYHPHPQENGYTRTRRRGTRQRIRIDTVIQH
jgi:hypothetical protein